MGSGASRPASAAEIRQEINELQADLAERIRALELKKQISPALSEEDYVHILNADGEAPPPYTNSTYGPQVSITLTEQWEKELLHDPKNRLALNALTTNAATAILQNPSAAIADTQVFNIRIPSEGRPVTNQRSSGRCWLFAATNVFRIAVMKNYNLRELELSQAYLFYWDKIEKANYFLENVTETIDEPLNGRLLQSLLASPVGDGGQWDMVANLVKKYGLVPQSLYPDAFSAKSSSFMDRIITTKLREDALRLRAMLKNGATSASAISSAKEQMMREIHRIVTLMLGPPPSPNKPFKWEFHDKNGTFHSVTTTPRAFAGELSDPKSVRKCGGTDINKLFSLVNDPRNPYLRLLTVSRLGNVKEGRPITYVNVDMKTMKAGCIDMLKRGFPVFFGSDVGKYSDSQKGILDTALFDYELGFNIKLGLSKAERLRTGESAMTHAMVLTGVHVEDGKSVRWRVENSWSEESGDKGYWVMSDEWMDGMVFQAVVDPSVVSREVKDVLRQEPLVLDLWDPMGALAY